MQVPTVHHLQSKSVELHKTKKEEHAPFVSAENNEVVRFNEKVN